MSERSNLMLAALGSAAMPTLAVAAVRASEQTNDTDTAAGIDHAVLQDSAGKLYDVFVSSTKVGRKRLADRARAAQTLHKAKEAGAFSFSLDQILAYRDESATSGLAADNEADAAEMPSDDSQPAVLISAHHNGQARSLDLLTLDDCASVGTCIGAIHRLNPNFLQENNYPIFNTDKIRSQLTIWIKRLRMAGHIPQSITESWARIIDTEGLWSFSTCMVHGGFSDGDLIFSGSTITAVTNWQDMQLNDPARDLAWLFARLDDDHRTAAIAAYGRLLGSRLDDLIMLRANLWLQMEEVGDFINALNRADNAKIMQFKARVERLAHQLSLATERSSINKGTGQRQSKKSMQHPPSTITVGTLLDDSARRSLPDDDPPMSVPKDTGDEGHWVGNEEDQTGESDPTAERDQTGPSKVHEEVSSTDAGRVDNDHRHPPQETQENASSADGQSGDTVKPMTGLSVSNSMDLQTPHPVVPQLQRQQEEETIVLSELDKTGDSTADHPAAPNPETATVFIPRLEQKERALSDAQSGLDELPNGHGTADHSEVDPKNA